MKVRRGKRCAEDGAIAVEFALVLPLLAALLFGIITLGLTYNDHLSISNAVREGARYGAAIDYTASGWASSVRERVKQVYFNEGETLNNSQICVELVNSSGTALTSLLGGDCAPPTQTAPSNPTTTAGSCAVKVWVTRPHDIELLIIPSLHVDLRADSVSYYGRTVAPGCPAE